jgi:hypothetical protein
MVHWGGPLVRPARIRVTTVAAVLFFVAPLVAEAQSTKVWRVGYLTPVIANGNPRLVAFQQRLRELGYVEPQNIVLDLRTPGDTPIWRPISYVSRSMSSSRTATRPSRRPGRRPHRSRSS